MGRPVAARRPFYCLVLTATIDPRGCPGTARADPGLRLADYRAAIEGWARETKDLDLPVVLVENSGADASALERTLRRVWRGGAFRSLLQYEEDPEVFLRGKSEGEARLLERSVAYLSGQLGEDFTFLKATGRLYVRKLARSLPARRGDFTGLFRPDLSAVDSRVFLCTAHTYRRWMWAMGQEVDERHRLYFEMVLARRLHLALAIGDVRLDPFRSLPRIVGIGASAQTPYWDLRSRTRRIGDDLARRAFQRRGVFL